MNKWHKVQTLDDWPKETGKSYIVKTLVPDSYGWYNKQVRIALFNSHKSWSLDGEIVVAWMPIPGDDEDTAHWDG